MRLKESINSFRRLVMNERAFHRLQVQWKNLHPDTNLALGNAFDFSLVSIGRFCYGPLNINAPASIENPSHLFIGNFVSIAPNVVFLLCSEHPTNLISTFPFRALIQNASKEASLSKGDIIVDDDVWIGYGATILSGVHIGQGAVVGTEAVVTKDVEPYAVVGGNPAHVIRYRFLRKSFQNY
jgi:virginiamycin A acetyltransferase